MLGIAATGYSMAGGPVYYAVGFLSSVVVGPVVGAIYGLPLMLVLGLPIHTALLHLKLPNLAAYAVAGAVAVATTLAIVGIPGFSASIFDIRDPSDFRGHLVFHSTLGLLAGGATGATFWLIRRPDRDAPNPPTAAP